MTKQETLTKLEKLDKKLERMSETILKLEDKMYCIFNENEVPLSICGDKIIRYYNLLDKFYWLRKDIETIINYDTIKE